MKGKLSECTLLQLKYNLETVKAFNFFATRLYIRAMPVYADPSFFTEPVRRCPNHASPTDSTNANIPEVKHERESDVLISHNICEIYSFFLSYSTFEITW